MSKIQFDDRVPSRVTFEMPEDDFETILKNFEKNGGQIIYDKDKVEEERLLNKHKKIDKEAIENIV